VKTLMSLITAVLAYIILLVFDINYAPVWAMLVFFLNFIPVVGSIIAVILPMAMAVLQFWEISPWVIFVVTGLLIGVQQFVGSFLEPRFLGSSLNLSPLIILVSLSFWGFLWGPVGMLISVPVTVMMAIIFASVPATRWVAVLLSQNGDSVQEEFGPVVMPTTGRTTDPS
jgi:predicted PurR-regulated permease PerM